MKKPNVKQIETIIKDLEIKPNYISSYFIEHGMCRSKKRKVKGKNEFKEEKVVPIADRTFFDILKGKETKEKSLKALAELFSNIYKKNDKNKIISLSDISIEEEGPLKNNLRIVNNYKDLINDRRSHFRIPFFNFDINEETEPKINILLKLIDEIYDSYYGSLRSNSEEERTSLSKYSKELKNISEVNSCLKFLSEKKIYLYTGELKDIPIFITHTESRTEYVQGVSEYPDKKIFLDASASAGRPTYNIYYFTKYKIGNYIDAIYKPLFNFSEIQKVIQKNPFKKSYELPELGFNESEDANISNYKIASDKAELDCASFYGDIFKNKFNFSGMLPFNFDRNRIEFVSQKNDYRSNYYVEGEDTVLDQYLAENNLTYEEALERAEDQYYQLQSDIERGK